MKILLIGGSSVSGQCCIRAAKHSSINAEIIATTSKNVNVVGADKTIYNIDLDSSDSVEKIIDSLKSQKLDRLVYIPARGQVGIPVDKATGDMVLESYNYCLKPALELQKALDVTRTIMLSGFITMKPMLEVYGAMTYTKLLMEQLAIQYPDKIQILRIGMFLSNSVRGIALLVQRNMQKEKKPEYADLYRQWKESKFKKFQDFFWHKNYHWEEKSYRQHSKGTPFRATTENDIERGFIKAFAGEIHPIINILGNWSWTENKMVKLPKVVEANTDFFPKDLEKYLQEP